MKGRSSLLIVISILFIPFCLFPFFTTGQTSGDAETPSMITDLAGNEIVWRIENATGVFADEDYQTGDLIKYKVMSADLPTQKYIVTLSKKSWAENDYVEINGTYSSTYFLVARNWGDTGNEYVAEVATYWGSDVMINREFVSSYLTDWWNLNLINTVSIRYEMNESNYDESIYTRAEGILLSRTAVVNADSGGDKGYLKISLVSYSGFFTLSPWYWLVMFIVVVAFIAVIIGLIASVVRKREMLMEDAEQISYGGAIIGVIFVAYGLYSMIQAQFNPTSLYPGLEADLIITPIGIIFVIMGLLLTVIMTMNKDRVVRIGTTASVGLIIIGALLLLIWNLMKPTNLYEAFDFLDLGIELYLMGCVFMVFGAILILLLNLKEERDVGIAIAIFIIVLGISIYFMFDLSLYYMTLSTVFDVNILRIFISLILMQMGLVFIIMGPFVIFLPLLRKR